MASTVRIMASAPGEKISELHVYYTPAPRGKGNLYTDLLHLIGQVMVR
jgi:hypothetical protein